MLERVASGVVARWDRPPWSARALCAPASLVEMGKMVRSALARFSWPSSRILRIFCSGHRPPGPRVMKTSATDRARAEGCSCQPSIILGTATSQSRILNQASRKAKEPRPELPNARTRLLIFQRWGGGRKLGWGRKFYDRDPSIFPRDFFSENSHYFFE